MRTAASGRPRGGSQRAARHRQVTAIGGGFPARSDIEPTDANATALGKLLDGVDVFRPDWTDIDKNLDTYVDAWKSATGS